MNSAAACCANWLSVRFDYEWLHQSRFNRRQQMSASFRLKAKEGSHLTDFMPAAEAARAKEILARVDEDENKDGATCASAFHTRH